MADYERDLAAILSDEGEDEEANAQDSFVYPGATSQATAGAKEHSPEEEGDEDSAGWSALPDTSVRKRNQIEEAALEWQHDSRWEGEPDDAAQKTNKNGNGALDLKEYNRRMREIMGEEADDEEQQQEEGEEEEEESFTYPGSTSEPAPSASQAAIEERSPSPEPYVVPVCPSKPVKELPVSTAKSSKLNGSTPQPSEAKKPSLKETSRSNGHSLNTEQTNGEQTVSVPRAPSARLSDLRVPSRPSSASYALTFTQNISDSSVSHKRKGKLAASSRRPKAYPSLTRLRAGPMAAVMDSVPTSQTPSVSFSSHHDAEELNRSVSMNSIASSSQSRDRKPFYPYAGTSAEAWERDAFREGDTDSMVSGVSSIHRNRKGLLILSDAHNQSETVDPNRQYDGAGVPLTVEAGQRLLEMRGRDLFRWSNLRKINNRIFPSHSLRDARERQRISAIKKGKKPERDQDVDSEKAPPEPSGEATLPMNDSEYEAMASNLPMASSSSSQTVSLPTVVCAASRLIAVGMSDGKTLVFDYAQELIATYWAPAQGAFICAG